MGQVTVQIAGRSYKLLCRDGEEDHLTALAGHIEGKAADLTAALGAMSEPRLLLMAGLQVADELFEARKGSPVRPDDEFAALLARVEALADMVDQGT